MLATIWLVVPRRIRPHSSNSRQACGLTDRILSTRETRPDTRSLSRRGGAGPLGRGCSYRLGGRDQDDLYLLLAEGFHQVVDG